MPLLPCVDGKRRLAEQLMAQAAEEEAGRLQVPDPV